MTLIGAFNCIGGVVLFADRQETITDYAKWDTPKVYQWTVQDSYRFVLAAAGETDAIEMIWQAVSRECKTVSFQNLKDQIIKTTQRVTRKSIFPLPKDERIYPDIIWAIQPISQEARNVQHGIDLFRTYRLFVDSISSHYFTGSPVLLARFINDQYMKAHIIGLEEAEALSTYLLWEAKEYDTNCGKYSDVFTLRTDGHIGRLTIPELQYWEDHWRQFKQGIRLLPMLSCSGRVADSIYLQRDYLQRVVTTVKTLNSEQKKMRAGNLDLRNKLEQKLMKNLRRTAQKARKPNPPNPKESQR